MAWMNEVRLSRSNAAPNGAGCVDDAVAANRWLRFLGFVRNDMKAFGIAMGLRWPREVMKVVGTGWELLAPRGHAGRGVTLVFAWPRAPGFRIKSGTTEKGMAA